MQRPSCCEYDETNFQVDPKYPVLSYRSSHFAGASDLQVQVGWSSVKSSCHFLGCSFQPQPLSEEIEMKQDSRFRNKTKINLSTHEERYDYLQNQEILDQTTFARKDLEAQTCQ
jgi:hypothetical protein